ncbi:ankyrin repeat domain-containing protein [Wolbachia endosymbiont of Armadillidium arcangelii]|uniref:Ankyrin repeat domain-containing protein n=1 Tax=Wolbachia endosymbiont of Armadillidium arcangelii TaxID=3158571 RepID=A0AAU7Q0G6_9RICK
MNEVRVAELILRYVDKIDNEDGHTPLHWAAKNNHFNIVETLLNRGANINVVDELKRTPLHLAAMEGHKDVVKILLNQGAGVNAVDRFKKTPLILAAYKGCTEVAKVLIEAGADVSIQDNQGNTFIKKTLVELEKLYRKVFLHYGQTCSFMYADYFDATPVISAEIRGKIEWCRLLLKQEANIDSYEFSSIYKCIISILEDKNSDRKLIGIGELIDLLQEHYYELSDRNKSILKDNCPDDFEIYGKMEQMLSCEFPTIYRVILLCNERPENVLNLLKNRDNRDRLKEELKAYRKNCSYAPFPTYDWLKNYLPFRIECKEREIKREIGRKEREIEENITRGKFAVVSSQKEGEERKDEVVFRADNMLYSILTNMDSNNNSSGKIEHIVYRQADIFKKELEKFDKKDLQNIAVASLIRQNIPDAENKDLQNIAIASLIRQDILDAENNANGMILWSEHKGKIVLSVVGLCIAGAIAACVLAYPVAALALTVLAAAILMVAGIVKACEKSEDPGTKKSNVSVSIGSGEAARSFF